MASPQPSSRLPSGLAERLTPQALPAAPSIAVFSFVLQIQCDPAWHSVPSAPLTRGQWASHCPWEWRRPAYSS